MSFTLSFLRAITGTLLLGSISLIAAPTAAETWYQVEVILVGYLNEVDMDEEYWPPALEQPSSSTDHVIISYPDLMPNLLLKQAEYERLLAEENPTADSEQATVQDETSDNSDQPAIPVVMTDLQYPLADDAELVLQDMAQRISRSRDMTVLAHYAWNELIQDKSAAIQHPVSISADKAFNIQLDGAFKLYKSRYIHIESDWLVQHYNMATALNASSNLTSCSPVEQPQNFDRLLNKIACPVDATPTEIPLRAASIMQSRRMRSEEVHYLDHPLVGIIATTRKIDDPRPIPPTEVTADDVLIETTEQSAVKPANSISQPSD